MYLSNLSITVFQCHKIYTFTVFHHICWFTMSSGVKILLLHHSFHIPFPVHCGVFYVTDYTQCLVCHVSLSLVFQPAFCTMEQKAIIHDWMLTCFSADLTSSIWIKFFVTQYISLRFYVSHWPSKASRLADRSTKPPSHQTPEVKKLEW